MSGFEPLRVSVVITLLLIWCGAPAVAGGSASPVSEPAPAAGAALGFPLQSNQTERNISYIPHERLEIGEEESDLRAVREWIALQLGARLNTSIRQLQAGRYSAARSTLDDGYSRELTKYTRVERMSDRSDARTGSFRRARRIQLRFISEYEEFQKTLANYHAAKRRGDAITAQVLDSRLRRQATSLNTTAVRLMETHDTITVTTQAYLFPTVDLVRELLLDVTRTRDRLPAPESFERTVLTVRVDADPLGPINPGIGVTSNMSEVNTSLPPSNGTNTSRTVNNSTELRDSNTTKLNQRYHNVSFTDPVLIKGQLMTPDGRRLFDEVDLRVGRRNITVQTNRNGTFSLLYRPIKIPPGRNTIQVQYLSGIDNRFLGTAQSVRVNVTSVKPDLTVEAIPTTAGYGDNISVSGRVQVGPIGVAGVPVEIRADQWTVGRTMTGTDGRFAIEGSIPMTLNPGSRTLEAEIDLVNASIKPVTGSTTFEVRRTETRIGAHGTIVNGDRLYIEGRLVSAVGGPLEDAPVTVVPENGNPVTVRTNSQGWYNVTVPWSKEDRRGRSLEVQYSGAGTNFAPATANVAVDIGSVGPQRSRSLLEGGPEAAEFRAFDAPFDSDTVLVWVFGVFGVIAISGWLVLRRQREEIGEVEPVAPVSSTDGTETSTGIDPTRLLDYATNQLSVGNVDIAVLASYAALRQADHIGPTESSDLTQWEFLQACRDNGLAEHDLKSLHLLTQLSERAAFDTQGVDEGDAMEAVSLVRRLLGEV